MPPLNVIYMYNIKLKADRPHPRDYSTHRQRPWTDNDSSLLFSALGKAEPLISTAARQKFNFIKVVGQTVQPDWRTDGRYQVHYLPRFAVDKDTYGDKMDYKL